MPRVRIVTYEALERSDCLRRLAIEALAAGTTNISVMARYAGVDIPRHPQTKAISFVIQETDTHSPGILRVLGETADGRSVNMQIPNDDERTNTSVCRGGAIEFPVGPQGLTPPRIRNSIYAQVARSRLESQVRHRLQASSQAVGLLVPGVPLPIDVFLGVNELAGLRISPYIRAQPQ